MDYNIFKKSIKFKDRNFPVEIFCKEEYKDYYIRGQVIDLSSLDYPLLTRGSFSIYHLIVFVLVHKEYIEKSNGSLVYLTTIHNSEFCTFAYNTRKDFELFQKMGEDNAKNDKLYSGNFKGINKNPIISIELEDVPIVENRYLDESIKSGKKIILIDLSIHLYKKYLWDEFPPSLQDNKEAFDYYNSNCSTRIHSLCGYHLVYREKSSEKSVYNWFDNLYEKIYWKLGYHHLKKHIFFKILSLYGRLSHKKIFSSSEPINITKYIRLLIVYAKLWQLDDIYPLTRFCNSFFNDLIDDLKNCNMIKECQFCGDFFKYKGNKKYCSVLSKYEDKNCRRQAIEQRRYKKKKLKIY